MMVLVQGSSLLSSKSSKNELSEIKEGIRKKVWCQDDIKLYKKQGEKKVIVKKASKLVTAKKMRSSLIQGKPYLGIFAIEKCKG